jgi:hypothetical protein
MTKEQAQEFYNNKRAELKIEVKSKLEHFIEISEALSKLCKAYKHNLY